MQVINTLTLANQVNQPEQNRERILKWYVKIKQLKGGIRFWEILIFGMDLVKSAGMILPKAPNHSFPAVGDAEIKYIEIILTEL
jgi:hypothetical protein